MVRPKTDRNNNNNLSDDILVRTFLFARSNDLCIMFVRGYYELLCCIAHAVYIYYVQTYIIIIILTRGSKLCSPGDFRL